MRGTSRFVFLVFFLAGMNLCVKGVVMFQLTFDSGLRQIRRKRIFDADALVEGDEAQNVKAEV
jgi:hypothetical protein